jgi:Type III restriction enzyme, res subunit
MRRGLGRWPAAHFKTLIIDECHRSAATTYRRVLEHFEAAKVLGVTATPDRSDQRSLGEIFEEIAFEIELPRLIEDRGDLDVAQAGGVVAPHLYALAAELARRRERKILVFLPFGRTLETLRSGSTKTRLGCGAHRRHLAARKEILERFSRDFTWVLSCRSRENDHPCENRWRFYVVPRPRFGADSDCRKPSRSLRAFLGRSSSEILIFICAGGGSGRCSKC